MMDHLCEVCQEYLATHIITFFIQDKEYQHYLCDDDYEEMDNPRRFLSLLEYPLEKQDTLFHELFPD